MTGVESGWWQNGRTWQVGQRVVSRADRSINSSNVSQFDNSFHFIPNLSFKFNLLSWFYILLIFLMEFQRTNGGSMAVFSSNSSFVVCSPGQNKL